MTMWQRERKPLRRTVGGEAEKGERRELHMVQVQ